MRRFLFLSVLIGLLSAQQSFAQVKTQTPPDDVISVKTELVQTDLTVVDKRGHFVDGLTANDFELRVDSKPQPLSFFEKVSAGSVDEEKQLTAARKGDKAALAKLQKTSASATDRGRVVFFFVDRSSFIFCRPVEYDDVIIFYFSKSPQAMVSDLDPFQIRFSANQRHGVMSKGK